MRKRNFDDFTYRNIPETELKDSVFVGTPTSTEVSLSRESNEQDGNLALDDSKNSQQKSKAKRVTYSNRLRESLLQD